MEIPRTSIFATSLSPRSLLMASCITGIFLGFKPTRTAPIVSTATASLPITRTFGFNDLIAVGPEYVCVASMTARSILPIAS